MTATHRPNGIAGWLQSRATVLAALAFLALTPMAAFAAPWGSLVSEDGSQRIALEGDEVIVGSSETAGARIEHETVSPRHAVIRHDNGVVTVADLGSRFGTLFSGTELRKGKPMRIVQRTLLTFGAVTWAFEWGERSTIPPTQGAAAESGKSGKSVKSGKSGKSGTAKAAGARGTDQSKRAGKGDKR